MNFISEKTPVNHIFESLGLASNDTVFISSDLGNLAKMARKQGEPFNVNTWIEALQSVLYEGTIIIPAFTDSLLDGDSFDTQKSKPTIGALSNKIFRRKDFQRTSDPLHSVFVWGTKAKEIIELNDSSTFGENSIFGWIQRNLTTFLFIDVNFQDSFTFVHSIEEREEVGYRRYYRYEMTVDGKKKSVRFHTKKLGFSTDLNALENRMTHNQSLVEYQYGDSKIRALKSDVAEKEILDCLRNSPRLHSFSWKLFVKGWIRRYILRKKGVL